MEHFHLGDLLKGARNVRETVIIGCFGKIGVQVFPFKSFLGCGSFQIALRVTDHTSRIGGGDLYFAPFQILKEYPDMFLFVVCRFEKDISSMFIAFFINYSPRVSLT